jgi:diguanylate cyclase (GGDEF)-like protein/PAS domain S-box-containing protein
LRVLHVEDNPLDALLMARAFENAAYGVAWTRVETEAEYHAALETLPQVVIADYTLPQFSGLRALEILKQARPEVPFILVSGTIGEEKAAEVIRLGADDYLLKDRLARLPLAVERAVNEAEDRAAHEIAKAEIEAGLRRAQRMAKLAHVITGPDGAFESWSETLPQLVGADPDRLPATTRAWLEIIHPQDRALFRAKSIQAGKTRQRADVEYRLQRADGALIHVRQTMEPLAAEPGAHGRVRWFNTLQNITEIIASEQALRESERLKGAIIQASLDALVTIDGRGSILEFNPAAEAVFGVSRDQAIGQPMAGLIIPPRLREAHYRGFMRYLATGDAPIFGKRLELEALRADGTEFPIELAVVPIGGRGTPMFTGFIRDITQRKLAEGRIKRLNRVYAVLSGINAAIVRIRDRQELFQESCRIAVEAGCFVMAWIGVVDREASIVKPVASAGDVRGFFDTASLAILENNPGGHGLAGRAIRSKLPVISNDVKNDSQWLMRKELDERGINSLAIIPLMVNGEAVGVLALHATDAGFFDDEEMRLLAELAGDVSFALDHIEKAEKANYLAYYDSLTGLANRTLFHERLAQMVRDAERVKRTFALAIVDIERFKTINDTFGRTGGDELLKQIAERFAHYAGERSSLARIAADHFAIVGPGIRSAEDAARVADQRLVECFAAPFLVKGTELRVAGMLGIALYPEDGTDAEVLFRNAETALKKAKATGERYLFYTQEMTERVAEKLSLENKLRQALEKEEFVLHYQPKVELENRQIVGVEALIRWQSPDLGLVPPAKFIPLLEETSLILQVGSWALARAALDHRGWVEQGLKAPRVAVNVSQVQLRQRDFVRVVEQAIIGGVAPTGIDLEITESLVMQDIEANIAKLHAVRNLGMKIAIDDFGTGYSSLAYLAKLPVETLKIDRVFISSMLDDPHTATLVQTVISMAHSLGLKVVAEGVETEEQAKVLRLLRCDEMQGYVFSKALPLEQVTTLLGASVS